MEPGRALRVIRPYRDTDAALVFEAAAESVEHVSPWMAWCHPGYTLAESESWVRHCIAAWREATEYNFVIEGPDGRCLGGCGLNQINREHRVANLGYWIRASALRRGVATEAVRQVAEFAFGETDLARLEIVVAVGNAPSLGVAASVGAIREGLVHDRLYVHGRSHDAVMHALLRSCHARATT